MHYHPIYFPLDYYLATPVRGHLEPHDAANPKNWRYLQTTDTPNELKILLPPAVASQYDQLLKIELAELSKGANVSWERILEIRHLKDRMVRKCQRMSRITPPKRLGRGESFVFQSLVAPDDFRLKEMEAWLQQEARNHKPAPAPSTSSAPPAAIKARPAIQRPLPANQQRQPPTPRPNPVIRSTCCARCAQSKSSGTTPPRNHHPPHDENGPQTRERAQHAPPEAVHQPRPRRVRSPSPTFTPSPSPSPPPEEQSPSPSPVPPSTPERSPSPHEDILPNPSDPLPDAPDLVEPAPMPLAEDKPEEVETAVDPSPPELSLPESPPDSPPLPVEDDPPSSSDSSTVAPSPPGSPAPLPHLLRLSDPSMFKVMQDEPAPMPPLPEAPNRPPLARRRSCIKRSASDPKTVSWADDNGESEQIAKVNFFTAEPDAEDAESDTTDQADVSNTADNGQDDDDDDDGITRLDSLHSELRKSLEEAQADPAHFQLIESLIADHKQKMRNGASHDSFHFQSSLLEQVLEADEDDSKDGEHENDA
ncbi:hypothetical protein CYLTODRAFT_425428 [Cylindrobasidium torrendii FP15055 ss-10]|uniref:Uncharacterized protein n=1 Tax=Cylindrobasidium torrendii FP15055 ss-10 TaxID=1314674 RepID=A0A0D7B147_9AGAR|nr:hypothetical protein CYLTODRAFT_425428 [Cylindrobasidium torrendii FP15055 ss-10]